MKVKEFDFDLPPELIANRPPPERDAARMLVVGDETADAHIKDFINFLRPGDVVVFNDSRVIPCRFDTGGGYEFTLHTKTDGGWLALAKKFNKLKPGQRLKLTDGTEIEILDVRDESGVLIRFLCDDVFGTLERVGKIPLPPYIKRPADEDDRARYQTVFARAPGSMAAPTAGLHFTKEMIDEIKKRATVVNVTLHVGAGTWLPVKADDTKDHKMHKEFGIITGTQAETINAAKRVIAVGTTSLRLLESAAQFPSPGGVPRSGGKGSRVRAFDGATDIFITPGYRFKVADVLLTNFHLPKSTLFMLVCAFAGTDEMRAAYAHAVLEKYRFFSYGDCCLLFKRENHVS
jgi:S-adenosylmethionine:tRNA ribosyltransferase-isomerase